MASGMTSTAKRQEGILVAQILASLRHMVNVCSIKITDRAVRVQCKVFLSYFGVLFEFLCVS
jgi:hypothetical protein